MPKIIAAAIADAVHRCHTDAELRNALRAGVEAADQYGFNHGNPKLWEYTVASLQALIDAEHDPQHRHELQAAQDLIGRVRDGAETH
jgi:hypothetical protein